MEGRRGQRDGRRNQSITHVHFLETWVVVPDGAVTIIFGGSLSLSVSLQRFRSPWTALCNFLAVAPPPVVVAVGARNVTAGCGETKRHTVRERVVRYVYFFFLRRGCQHWCTGASCSPFAGVSCLDLLLLKRVPSCSVFFFL